VREKLAGRYELVRELGAGAMGRVFLATDTTNGRAVAIKLLMAGSDADLSALLRFQQEGALLSTLKHPNIVEVYGTFLDGETSCIVMEFLDGRSLRQIFDSERILLPRLKRIAQQVAAAMAYAHGRGIIHRDIKPDNIMVIGNDHVKVTDFGVARVLLEGATLATRTGMSIGTPLYMAPEQIEGQKVDGRADIYSLGAVLYQMVTGRPPFEGDDPLTVAFKHVHRAPEPPRQVNADVPPDWEELILRALAKDPAQRFQTAGAMEEAIAALGTGEMDLAAEDTIRTTPDTIDRILRPEMSLPPRLDAEVHPAMPPVIAPAVEQAPARAQTPPPATAPNGRPAPQPAVPAAVGAAGERATSVQPVPGRPAAQVRERPARREDKKSSGVPMAALAGGILLLLLLLAGGAYALLLRPHGSKAAVTQGAAIHLSVAGRSAAGAYPSGQTVTLHWTAVKNAIYRLQVASSAVDPSDAVVFAHPLKTLLLETNSYRLPVVGAQFYYWRIQPEINGKWEAYTPSTHFQVAKPSVGVPKLLTPKNGVQHAGNQVKLCWSAVSGASGYRVTIEGAGSFSTTSTCKSVAVEPGTYRWSVAAEAKGVKTYVGASSPVRKLSVVARVSQVHKKARPKKKAHHPARPAQPAAPSQQPVQSAPQQPVQPAPQQPVQQAPVQQAPVQQAPVQQAPVQQAPVQPAPVQQAPVQPAPAPKPAPQQPKSNPNCNPAIQSC
jgi:serine/threonine protein kinase